MCEKYNGWTNRETWLIGLWHDLSEWDDVARAVIDNGEGFTRNYLAGHIKSLFEDQEYEVLKGIDGFWNDLMGGALANVNWYEIADHILDDLDN